MTSFFKEIFKYHHQANHSFIEPLIRHEASLPSSCQALFCHLLNAQQIWNARILGEATGEVHALFASDMYYYHNEAHHLNTLRILDNIPLDMTIAYQNTRGESFENSVRDILFHINNHSTHHRAQIAMKMRDAGIAPVPSDYIFYRRSSV